jgi:hypothetical protein
MYELVGGAAAARSITVAEPVRSMYVSVDHDCSKPSTVHDSIEAPKGHVVVHPLSIRLIYLTLFLV